MPLNISKGQMYSWVTHTHSSLGGECPHRCSYCYVDSPRWGRPPRYTGALRLLENEMRIHYSESQLRKHGGQYPATIFIEHMNDLWAADVPDNMIQQVLEHCRLWPDNTYVYQTKNPARYLDHLYALPTIDLAGNLDAARHFFPAEIIPALMEADNEAFKPDLVVLTEHYCAVADALGICKFSTAETYATYPEDLAAGQRAVVSRRCS
jgi:hypothetical protein